MSTPDQDSPDELEFDLILEGDDQEHLDVDQELPEPPEESPNPPQDAPDPDDDDSDEDDHRENSEELSTEEKKSIQERRREERRRRKEFHRNQVTDLRAQLAVRDQMLEELNQRLNSVEHRGTEAELTRVDAGINQAAQNYNYYKSELARATSESDGEAAAEATEKMLQARVRHAELTNLKKQMTSTRQSPTPPLDPRMVDSAREWMSRNNWYDPKGQDQDSQVVLTIDRQLARENFNPNTSSYWDELTRRVEKYLPHRVKRGKIEIVGGGNQNPNPPPSRGASSGATQGKKRDSFTLSKDRVQAMKEAGVWEDPKKRNDMIRRYQEMDRQNRQQGK